MGKPITSQISYEVRIIDAGKIRREFITNIADVVPLLQKFQDELIYLFRVYRDFEGNITKSEKLYWQFINNSLILKTEITKSRKIPTDITNRP